MLPKFLKFPACLDPNNNAELKKCREGLDATIELRQFKLSHLLLQGKHNQVYLARHPTDDSNFFAIKVIEKLGQNSKKFASIQLEYQVLWSNYDSSHCQMKYCYSSDDRLYFVMEFISGASL